MSIWSDIQNRSAGESIRDEEFNLLYKGGVVKSVNQGEYKDIKYDIDSSGEGFPFVELIFSLDVSIFSGASQVILKDGDESYTVERRTINNAVHFYYYCNKDGDYVDGNQDGHKYGIDELRYLAEKLIDLILDAEDKLFDEK